MLPSTSAFSCAHPRFVFGLCANGRGIAIPGARTLRTLPHRPADLAPRDRLRSLIIAHEQRVSLFRQCLGNPSVHQILPYNSVVIHPPVQYFHLLDRDRNQTLNRAVLAPQHPCVKRIVGAKLQRKETSTFPEEGWWPEMSFFGVDRADKKGLSYRRKCRRPASRRQSHI